jgi:hypothetical protein
LLLLVLRNQPSYIMASYTDRHKTPWDRLICNKKTPLFAK